MPDGHVKALNKNGEKLILTLRLDSKRNVDWRRDWMGVLELLEAKSPELYRRYMGFPDELPDLRNKKAPRNTKPKSVDDCFFVQRQRGTLPQTY